MIFAGGMIKMEVLMKKRILCLVLGCVMLLSAFLFVGCAQEEDAEADVATNTGAKTITLRLISQNKVCNTDEELAEYLKNECGGDKNSKKYKDMLETMKAYEAVEDEIAKRTKSDFKTDLEILFYTEEEYYSKLEVSMAEYALEQKNAELAKRALEKYIKEYKASSTEEIPEAAIVASFYKYFPEYEAYKDFASEGGSSAEDDKYVENDLGIKELVYPEAGENQLDIVYISGYDMYMRYIENEWITPLNSFISTTGKKLTYNISQTILNGVKVEGETYAIPNNVQIGEYTYMLVDKELANKYMHSYESFSDITDCHVFINDVLANHKDVIPIDSTFKDCMDLFVWYWNVEYDEETSSYSINRDNNFSILGKYYTDLSSIGRGSIDLGFNSLLADKNYRDTLLCLKKYDLDGCYRTENDTRKDAAISFTNGTYSMMRNAFYKADGQKKDTNDVDYGVYTDKETGKEYYLYVAKYPKADQDSLYGNMYAVSANTKNTQACMEIITLINTDAQVRNLLQYGIKQGEQKEGQIPNYLINDEGVLERLNELYMMDIEKTGNCFIAYPEEGLAADYWEDAKAQNNDAVIDPLAGFDFNERLAEYGSRLDNNQLDYCAQLSKEVDALLNSPDATYESLKNLLGEDGELAKTYSQSQINHTFNAGTSNQTNAIIRLDKITNNKYDVSTGLGTPQNPEADPDGESPYTIYYNWLVSYKYLPEAE